MLDVILSFLAQNRTAVLVTASLITGTYLLFGGGKKQKTPTVSAIRIYPVKSLGNGQEEQSWPIDDRGFVHDRRWMVVKEEQTEGAHHFITIRQYPKMVQIHTHVTRNGTLTLKHNSHIHTVTTMSATEQAKAKRIPVVIWKKQFEALDCGDAAAVYLSDILGVKCRLVEAAPNMQREPDSKWTSAVSKEEGKERKFNTNFADAFPFLLTSEESLAQFNSKLEKQPPITQTRFRPNIVISGGHVKPFDEDTYFLMDFLDAGKSKIKMYNVKPCTRCTIPSIDPVTAERSDEVQKLLRSERMGDADFADKPLFGVNLCHELNSNVVELKVGDTVSVLAKKLPPLLKK